MFVLFSSLLFSVGEPVATSKSIKFEKEKQNLSKNQSSRIYTIEWIKDLFLALLSFNNRIFNKRKRNKWNKRREKKKVKQEGDQVVKSEKK